MEAMTVTVRAITNDLFFDKIKKQQHDRHKEKLKEIMDIKSQKLKTMEMETEKVSGVLRKAKEAAKNFEIRQRDIIRKKENKILLQKLWRISEGKQVAILPHPSGSQPQLKHINHRAEYQRRVSQRIGEENRYLAKNLVQQSRSKRSKSQIKSEIKEYLALRDSIRKKKSPPNKEASIHRSMKKSVSEKKAKRYSELAEKQPIQKRSPVMSLEDDQ